MEESTAQVVERLAKENALLKLEVARLTAVLANSVPRSQLDDREARISALMIQVESADRQAKAFERILGVRPEDQGSKPKPRGEEEPNL